jgi:hypothetical protein
VKSSATRGIVAEDPEVRPGALRLTLRIGP